MRSMRRMPAVFAIACWLVACGDDSGGGDASPADAAVIDAAMDAATDGTKFTCPMDGTGSGALQCTVPELNVAFFIDAGVKMLGPIPIEFASSVVMPKGCCTDDGKCGVTETTLAPGGLCFVQNQPGDKDGQCPDEVLTLDATTMIPIPGCCKPTNECGLELAPLGIGCAERGLLVGLLTSSGGRLPDGGIEGSLPCRYGNPGGHDDAGSDDGG